jgi:tRNA A-37 threonylcarbamoyl transferase component Bud32
VLGTLLGNYRVLARLGAGGMGVVYVGHHEALGRRVVMKVLQRELSNDADMVQRFFNEARAATAIRSPGIVQVFDFGVTPDRRAYFVMELLEGQSLAACLKQRRFDYTKCCRLGRQIANVLHAAHAAGIVHRDLKPANLFLVPDPEVAGGERVKVLDFGIAKLAGEAGAIGVRTRTGLIMGTPHYMSPEQCRSASAADARSDIYSLGCILFQIACGRPPFVFAGVGDIVAAHLHEPPPHPDQFAPGVPPGLSALIARMLAKHPDARPQTMAAVGQELDDLLRILDAASGPIRALLVGVEGSAPLPGMPPAYPVTPPASPLAVAPPAPLAFAAPAPVLPALAPPVPFAVAPPVPPGLAQPVRLPRPAIPNFSSIATTLRHLTGAFDVHRREHIRWLTYVLGALVIIGAVAAIEVVLANDHPGPTKQRVSYAKIVAARPASNATSAAASAAADATVSAAAAPDAAIPGAVPTPPTTTAPPVPPTASTTPSDRVAAECRRHQADRDGSALAQCAGQLRPLDPKLAVELATRAAEEVRSAPHVAAAQVALRGGALKQAKAEIDQVWPGSVDCADLKRAYDAAEAQAIDALATQLDSVKDASCAAYNQVLARYRAFGPPRVAEEAVRRVPCKPVPR